MTFAELIATVAAFVQVIVAGYTLWLCRKIGPRQIGWILFAAFAFMFLLRLCLAFPAPPESGPGPDEAHTRLALLALISSLLLLVGLICIERLYRARQRVERELHDNQTRLNQVAEHIQDVVWMVDRQNKRVLFVTPAYEKIWGRSRQSLYAGATPFLETIHAEDRERVANKIRQQTEGQFDELEYRIVRPDGVVRWIRDRSFPIRGDTGELRQIAGIAEDVTERKRTEEQRSALERKLLEAQKLESLGVLAGGIAHDFNNLLTAILGNASLAMMQTPETSPIRSGLTNIEKVSLQAAELCQQMLAYSGRGHFVVQRLDLNRLIEDMTHLLHVSISKTIVLKFDLGRDLPAVEADPVQIRQVILNLIINASEAIGEKSGVIRVRTGALRADAVHLADAHLGHDLSAGDYVFLEVTDTGQGMSPEVQAKIFDPFFTTKFTGRGLGLAAVLGIVRSHAGAIKVASEMGRGSTFTFLLPCAEGPVVELGTRPAPSPNEWRGTGTVLVVDDEETVRAITARMLESFGFQVWLAADGREAVQTYAVQADRISLVILDMTMPHMNGEQAFKEIRRIRPDARVVLTSGYSEQDATNHFVGMGLAGFLQKPFRIEELREKVRTVLASAPEGRRLG